MAKPEFTCPSTNSPCLYGHFCIQRKFIQEGGPSAFDYIRKYVEAVEAQIPDELVAADKSSYCSDERLQAIGIAAAHIMDSAETGTDERVDVREWASALAGNIVIDRQRNIGNGVEPV